MNESSPPGHTTLFIVAAVAMLAWGATGLLHRWDFGSAGYYYSPGYVVAAVSEGGAAEGAGIRVGDRMISVEGTAVEELPMQSRWPQPRIGETHSLVLDRDGERITTDITYRQPEGNRARSALYTLMVGLSFLGFGLWSLVAVRTIHGRRVAFLCLALAFASFQGPHLGTWDGVASHAEIAIGLLGIILLLRFLLTFPKPKRAGLSQGVTRSLYGAFFLFLGLLVVELFVHPALYNVYGVVTTVLILPLILWILVIAFHSLVKLFWAKPGETGMGWVVGGLLLAFVPPLIQMLAGTLIPGFSLPGSGSFQLLLAAIPAGLALGVRKHARMAVASP